MQKDLEIYLEYRRKILAYAYVMNIVSWDSATICPRGSFDYRGQQLEVIGEELYKLRTSDAFCQTIENLYNNSKNLEETLVHEIEVIREEVMQVKKIPMNELLAYEKLLNDVQNIWIDAKKENDFEKFAPYLKKIVDYKRKEAKWLETDSLKGYDVLLNNFEKGYTQKEYDEFFILLKKELVPFIQQVLKKKNDINNNLRNKSIAKDIQKEMTKYLGEVLCYDFKHGYVAESEHPFTNGTSSSDVRITVHYYKEHFEYAIFSAIHEMGHALYEQQVDKKLEGTFCDGGASMALHESQSRFYENIITRSKPFVDTHFSKFKEIYQESFDDVTADDFYTFINTVEASFIRTEADELTYPLHIMLRYDIEKELVNETLEIDDVEKVWNDKFKEYFGIEVTKASEGVLQDVHWSSGLFGYFPTYALGSAIASQLFFKMNKDFNVNDSLLSGNTKEINLWLKEKVHKHGSSKYPKDILKIALGEEFNPKYYIDYLKKKYSQLYGIKL